MIGRKNQSATVGTRSPGCNVVCPDVFLSVPDETIVPPDVPSYLSSQGTLSERQDVCIRVEAGGGPQPNGHVVDTAGELTAESQLGLPNVCAPRALRNGERSSVVCEGLLSIRDNCCRHPNRSVDTQLIFFFFFFASNSFIFSPRSLPAGYDSAVVCTDCMENSSSYSKDPDYLTHGFGQAGGTEYQQHSLPPPYSHFHPAEHHDPASHAAPLCNGTPNGIRKDIQGSAYPKNHNTLQGNQQDRKGKTIGASSNANSLIP